jgi:hypothetical protein
VLSVVQDLEQKRILAGNLFGGDREDPGPQTLARGFSHYRAASADLPTPDIVAMVFGVI